MSLVNILSTDIYPGQYTVIIPKTMRAVYYQYWYARIEKDNKTPEWHLARDWTNKKRCGIMLPGIGQYVVAVATSPEREFTEPIMYSKTTVAVNEDDLLNNYISATWPWPVNDLITPFWDIRCNCTELGYDQMSMLQYILKKMYCEFDAESITISELNNRTGCEGHPSNTHRTGRDVDFSYYTMDGDNHTQSPGYFGVDKLFSKGVIDLEKFDVLNTVDLWKLIGTHFPAANIRADERIVHVALKHAKKFNCSVVGDPKNKYHHNTHFHVSLGNEIKWP